MYCSSSVFSPAASDSCARSGAGNWPARNRSSGWRASWATRSASQARRAPSRASRSLASRAGWGALPLGLRLEPRLGRGEGVLQRRLAGAFVGRQRQGNAPLAQGLHQHAGARLLGGTQGPRHVALLGCQLVQSEVGGHLRLEGPLPVGRVAGGPLAQLLDHPGGRLEQGPRRLALAQALAAPAGQHQGLELEQARGLGLGRGGHRGGRAGRLRPLTGAKLQPGQGQVLLGHSQVRSGRLVDLPRGLQLLPGLFELAALLGHAPQQGVGLGPRARQAHPFSQLEAAAAQRGGLLPAALAELEVPQLDVGLGQELRLRDRLERGDGTRVEVAGQVEPALGGVDPGQVVLSHPVAPRLPWRSATASAARCPCRAASRSPRRKWRAAMLDCVAAASASRPRAACRARACSCCARASSRRPSRASVEPRLPCTRAAICWLPAAS